MTLQVSKYLCFFVVGILLFFPFSLRSDTLILKDGTAIRNVKIKELTGKQVIYHSMQGKEESIGYDRLLDVKYAPVIVPEAPKRPVMKQEQGVGANSAIEAVQRSWDEFQRRRQTLETKLRVVQEKINKLSSAGLSPEDADLTASDAREALNQALLERTELQEELEQLHIQQMQLVDEMTQLAKRMNILNDPPDRNYLWKSALVPGWGQYELGRKTEATIYFTGTLLLGTYYLYSYNQYQSNIDARQRNIRYGLFSQILEIPSTSLTFAARANIFDRRSSTYASRANLGLFLLSGFYFLNLADAYSEGGLFHFSIGESSRPLGDRSLKMSYSIVF